MAKAILAAVVTIAAGFFTMCLLPDPELGILVGVAVMGAFIICFSEKKKNPDSESRQRKQ